MTYWCYMLRNKSDEYNLYTYCGYTTSPQRRIRQHNEEIKGGAKSTRGKKSSWEFMFLMTGFKTNHNALSCEWKLKHPDGKKNQGNKYKGILGRSKAINEVLKLEKWTEKCDISNNECQYSIYVINELYQHLDLKNIPNNITINCIETFDKDTVELVTKS